MGTTSITSCQAKGTTQRWCTSAARLLLLLSLLLTLSISNAHDQVQAILGGEVGMAARVAVPHS